MFLYSSFLEKAGGAGGGGGGDPHFANVVFLSSFDGTDGATTATDDSASAHAMTFVGNAQIDTAVSKFGGGSLLLDGSGDHVQMADSDDFYLPGLFTIEAWVRPDSQSGAIFGHWLNNTTNSNFHLSYTFSSATLKRFLFTMAPTGNSSLATSVTYTAENIDQSVFHHVAIDRDGSDVVRLYVDGVMKASATISGGTNITAALRIGNRTDGFAPFKGWIDEPRITKGVARYASDSGFTVPTAAYPRS